jgi:hypothetical protein
MGLRKAIRSKKAIDVNYWRLKTFSLLDDGTLSLHVQGFVSSEAYGEGAEPVEEYQCLFQGADVALKSPFYGYLKTIPLFAGAEDDLTHSKTSDGLSDLPVTVLNSRSDVVYQNDPRIKK